ncbi:hypothetical protein ACFYSF_22515 [Streptomyces canus]|uniref:hypothetical protein n=1 Tax=Streptomyces canus TaxID=58343 RepID=UPI003699B8E4
MSTTTATALIAADVFEIADALAWANEGAGIDEIDVLDANVHRSAAEVLASQSLARDRRALADALAWAYDGTALGDLHFLDANVRLANADVLLDALH